MSAEDRGWGPPGCTADQLERVVVAGMLDTTPYFPLRVRREVAPLFAELCRWLVAERRRYGLSPLSSSGGYNKRKIAGTDVWSNHSWGLAADLNAATNPHRRPLATDMPPGTREKAASLGLRWGADFSKPDPMHFEFLGTPADARRYVAALNTQEEIVSPEDIEKVAQRVVALLGYRPDRMNAADREDRTYRVVKAVAGKVGVPPEQIP
jgi:hypothetical protein